jgi:hypothetical protein
MFKAKSTNARRLAECLGVRPSKPNRLSVSNFWHPAKCSIKTILEAYGVDDPPAAGNFQMIWFPNIKPKNRFIYFETV